MKKFLFSSVMISCAVHAMEKPLPPRPAILSLKSAHCFPCEKNKFQKFIVFNTKIRSLLEEQLKSITTQETIYPSDRYDYLLTPEQMEEFKTIKP